MSDLSLLRRDLLAFSKAIGHSLEPWQAEAFMLDIFIRVILAPRQSGKSRAMAIYALWCAFRRPGCKVLIVSASEDAARRLLTEVRRIAASSPLLKGSVVDDFAGLVTLTNGSEIRSVPPTEKQARGWSNHVVLVDEASLVPDEIFESALLPTVAARKDSHLILGSSAGPTSGIFYDLCMRGEGGDEKVRTFRWALKDCFWITPSMIEMLRASMSEVRFRCEMEGIFASGADKLFTRALLESIIADYPISTLATLRGPARVMFGVDWAATSDRSTCVAWARSPTANDDPVFMVVLAERWRAGEPLTNVIEQIVASPMHAAVGTSERNGIGEMCSQTLVRRFRERPAEDGGGRPRGVRLIREDVGQPREKKKRKRPTEQPPRGFVTKLNAVFTTSQMKSAAYGALRMLADRGQIVIPASASDLIRELQTLNVDLTASGTERIEASTGNDDVCDSAMLGLAPYKRRDGRWTTAMERFADGRRQSSDLDVPLDIETVETPNGIQVPASATYRSVKGKSLTMDPSAIRDKKTRIGSYVIKP